MFFELKLALKYARARRRSLARFTAAAAVIGIGAGVASLILAQALARGFADEMREKILANTAHISVFRQDGAEISDWKFIKRELEKNENVERVRPTTYESAVLIGQEGSGYALLRVTDESQIQNRQSEDLLPEILIGAELARKTGLQKGSEAQIITLGNGQTPNTNRVLIGETFQTGLYEYDSAWIHLSPAEYSALTGREPFTPSVLSISVEDIYRADKTAEAVRVLLGGNFRVLDWQEANQPLFAALSLERKVALAIIWLIIFIAALNITTTLALLVNERRLDIAVLRTCGARMRSLIAIFLFEGFLLGAIGIVAGVAVGLAGCAAGNYFRLIRLSAEVYSLSYIPFHPRRADIFLIIFTAFLVCLAATLYPAYKASRIKPLENLRT